MKLITKIIAVLGIMLLLSFYLIHVITQIPAPIPEQNFIAGFETELKDDVAILAEKYGSWKTEKVGVNFKCDKVCFYKSGLVTINYKDEEKSNFKVDKMIVDEDFCVVPDDEHISLKLEGLGSGTKVSEYN